MSDVFARHKRRWDKGQTPDKIESIEVHGTTFRVHIFESRDKLFRLVPDAKTNAIRMVPIGEK